MCKLHQQTLFVRGQKLVGRTNLKAALVISVLLAGFVPAVAAGGTIYVDADANGANDGSNWADAYNNLDYALYIARYGVELCHG